MPLIGQGSLVPSSPPPRLLSILDLWPSFPTWLPPHQISRQGPVHTLNHDPLACPTAFSPSPTALPQFLRLPPTPQAFSISAPAVRKGQGSPRALNPRCGGRKVGLVEGRLRTTATAAVVLVAASLHPGPHSGPPVLLHVGCPALFSPPCHRSPQRTLGPAPT